MRIHHLALRTADVDRLRRFYVDVLGLSARPAPRPGAVWLDAGGTVVMLEHAGEHEPAIPPGAMDLLAFAVDDREPMRARLERAGVRVEAETQHTLYFRDPDGRRVAVSSYPFA